MIPVETLLFAQHGWADTNQAMQRFGETVASPGSLVIAPNLGFIRSWLRMGPLIEIAERARMSKPNLLYYFRRKEDIYRAVLEKTLADWLAPLRGLDPEGEPLAEIENYVRAKMEMSRNNPKASRLFANEMLHGAPAIGDFLAGPMKVLVDETETSYQVGEFYTPDTEGGLRYDDPRLGLDWPLPVSVMSEKDRVWALLEDNEPEIQRRMAA